MTSPASHDPKVLFDALFVPTSPGQPYASPSGPGTRGTRINYLSLTNVTNISYPVTVWLVPSGGVAGAEDAVMWQVSIPPDGLPYRFLEGEMMDPGDMLNWDTTMVSAIAGRMTGWELED